MHEDRLLLDALRRAWASDAADKARQQGPHSIGKSQGERRERRQTNVEMATQVMVRAAVANTELLSAA